MNPDTFLARLEDGPLLLDGGLGSLFIAAGLDAGQDPAWWNIERPGLVEEAHRVYAEAGSRVVHTNTLGGTPPKLESSGLAGRCREVNTRAVEIARCAVGSGVLVAGDVGPTGLMRPPVGKTTAGEFRLAFEPQVATLAQAGADLLSIETMYDLQEALAAVTAALATGLPVLASMTFEKRKRGFFTIMGDPLLPSLAALADAGAHAVGFNCSVTSTVMVEMVLEAIPTARAPLIAQPNAGQPRVEAGSVTYDASPDDFAADILSMAKAGARLLGGCCGTTPAFIREAAYRLASAGMFRSDPSHG
jgi:methionine synthase I (cobalamin-dependent)